MAIKDTEAAKNAPRKTSDYLDLNRSVAANHFRTEKTKDPVVHADFKLSDFFTRRIFRWLYYYLQSRFGRKHPYAGYDAGDTGIYQLPDTAGEGLGTAGGLAGTVGEGRGAAGDTAEGHPEDVVLGVVGDWGTFTPESIAIAERMGGHHPHYTIHIGDTYYVGAPHEVINNFTDTASPWVRGSQGSFALLGNHEMYARGVAYFDRLLPTLGVKKADGRFAGQKAAYFCLQNKYWRILGLDTGYHSIGKIPLLEMIPWFAPRCRFPRAMMRWLNSTVKLDSPSDKRALLVLTHHQYISAFNETEYLTPARQLASCIGTTRPILWLWGHEHKFAVYEKAQVKGGPVAYGRCIGHGGMPIELHSFKKDKKKNGYSKLLMVDDRPMPGTEGFPLGFNGYAMVRISGPRLTVEYHDRNGPIYVEEWTADGKGGMTGDGIKPWKDVGR